MSTTVLLKSNLRADKLVFTAWLIAGLYFFLGCASPNLQSKPVSSIDARFQLHNATDKVPVKSGGSPSVSFYQNVLSSTLGSHCSYYPSDSRYAMMISKRCGPVLTMFKSFERYSREFDASHLGLPLVQVDGDNHFKDIPNECEWIN
jgi:putative component of membrane protein insertase Oxa1/YidC/SpoIIIJ protein YidD